MENKELIIKTAAYEVLKNKLLDTSLKNILINYKKNKSSTIIIKNEAIKTILDKIENNSKFKFIEIEEESCKDNKNIRINYDEFLPSIYKKELITILSSLYKKQKTLLEDQGINVLYLAFGELEWKDKTEKSVFSPLLFLPVSLVNTNNLETKKIVIESNDFLINNSLIKKLNDDFGFDIKYDISDNNENSLSQKYQEYIDFINKKISSFGFSINQNWRTIDIVSLSIFKFSSMDIYLDVEKNKEKIINSQIMNAMTGLNNTFNVEYLYSEEEVDNIISSKDYFHSLMTNSSQETAIQSAINGKSFVIQGPPGTGKSQTITNIISELIARNKKVLFVAEKKAALDVVYKSIENLGFADFLLLLHSNGTNKKDFSNDLYETLERGQKFKKINENFIINNDYNYNNSLEKMNNFVKQMLSTRLPIGRSLYSLIGDYQKLLTNPNKISFDIPNFEKIDNSNFFEIQNSLNKLNSDYKNIGFNEKTNSWYGLSILDIKLQDIERIKKISILLKDEIQKIVNSLNLEIYNNYKFYNEDYHYSLFNSFFSNFF
ncbi:DUF4011 domain-containing protein [Ureaplasma parvum]|uniref:DUF4011 domain-containing protein n=1 Tax=Ureaplasma parvum TaxID=134821 RepID=UPI00290E88F5|nr:DUF4011 domain-containing protein [Ureaplasma parvum]MDU7892028.1 DUF4011 domain-containing protein [Ureaplasma parvum]